jgi:hypothetical protein
VFATNLSVNIVETPGLLKTIMEEKRVQELPIGSHLAEDTKGPLIAGVSETY